MFRIGPQSDLSDVGDDALESILMQPPYRYRKVEFDALTKAELSWNLALSTTAIQGTQSAVAAGFGFSVVPKSA